MCRFGKGHLRPSLLTAAIQSVPHELLVMHDGYCQSTMARALLMLRLTSGLWLDCRHSVLGEELLEAAGRSGVPALRPAVALSDRAHVPVSRPPSCHCLYNAFLCAAAVCIHTAARSNASFGLWSSAHI